MAEDNPRLAGLVLGSHGLVTWGPTSKDCYRTTLRIVQKAADWLDTHAKPEPFGSETTPALKEAERRRTARSGGARAPRARQPARFQGDALR